MSEQISIELHGEQPGTFSYGESKSGLVRIRPVKDMDLNEVSVRLLVESKGKLSPSEYTIDEHIIPVDDATILSAGMEYEYPFELKNDSPTESYKGENVSIVHRIEAVAEYERGTAPKGIIGKISSMISGRKLKRALYVTAKYDAPFMLKGLDNQKFSQGVGNIFTLFMILLCAGIIAAIAVTQFDDLLSESIIGWAIGGLIISILLGIGLQRLVVKNLVGSFRVYEEKQDKEGFTIIIESQKAWSGTRDRRCSYKVIEKVVDTRGTSDSTYRHTIYQSPEQNVELDHMGGAHITFSFPGKNIPSINIEDVNIVSEVVLTLVTSFGLKLTYTAPFVLRKE